MRTFVIGVGLLATLVLAACGSSSPSPTPTYSPEATARSCPTAAPDATPADSPGASACSSSGSSGGAGGGGLPGGPGGAAGGPGGTVTVKWSERVAQSTDAGSSVVTEDYMAVAQLQLVNVDVGSWTITGQATVNGHFTSDVKTHAVTSLGTCDTHYTDNAGGSGTVAVEGGLEARDGFYQFYVNIPGVDGSNSAVRDDSGCFGANNSETQPWPVGPSTPGGSGDYTDSVHFTGSTSEPRTGGDDTVTWDITIEP